MTQKEALDIVKAGYNVYLTGCAGSGKTYLLQQFITSLRFQKKRTGITASTGVAATHLNGMTLHAWAGIGIKKSISEQELRELLQRKYLRKRFRETQVLIIDEVSMLSLHTFELVDLILREFRNIDEPFGGIQLVLSGDFFQLPPVGNESEKADYIYKSPLWQQADLKVCYLDKPYRQDDKRFLSMLDAIRENNVTKDTWDTLKLCFLNNRRASLPTKLFTHNSHADTVNSAELSKLSGVPRTYTTEVRGNPALGMLLQKNCLAPERLTLKKGALVMFVKNNSEIGYVNGTMGTVIGFTDDGYPIIETYDGREIIAYPESWEIEDDGEIKAKIIQVPLRLAWAITIHKSQGMSLDSAEIDLGKSFVEGMGYVALSRVRTLEGIKLRSVNRTALTVNREIIALDRRLREESDEIARELRNSYLHHPAKN